MDLLIPETKNTPKLFFNSTLNQWLISGRSYPKEATEFYEPLLHWINQCEVTLPENCAVEFKLEFFNTCSSKVLLDILVRLRKLTERTKIQLSIKWYYESDDEDMKDSGESLMHMARLPFELICY